MSGWEVRDHEGRLLHPVPEDYEEDLGREICDRMAMGQSLGMVCMSPGMPARRTVVGWADNDPAFRAALEKATRDCADAIVDELLMIADGWRVTEMSRPPS